MVFFLLLKYGVFCVFLGILFFVFLLVFGVMFVNVFFDKKIVDNFRNNNVRIKVLGLRKDSNLM